jgi:hypothetical protein
MTTQSGGGTDPVARALIDSSSGTTASKRAIVKDCVVAAFLAQLHVQLEETDTIDWRTIDDRVILKLGDGITDCIIDKGFQCPLLAPSFQAAKDNSAITLVSDLINAITAVVTQ